MDSTTDREREVANCLFQIDKLCDGDLRAVLRHIATDDAVFSEAQCSHIARVVDGTLHQKPREAVNAKLTCASGFDAAENWEKNFATYAYPGHVSDSLREYVADNDMQLDEPTPEQPLADGSEAIDDGEDVVMFGPNAPSIINKAHMNVHYHHHHYYKHSQSDDFIPSTAPLKRERQDDENYPGALSAPISIDQPKTDDTDSEHPSKRIRIQGPKTKKDKTKADKAKMDKTETEGEVHPEAAPDQLSVEQHHGPEHVKVKTCKVCGVRFVRGENKPQADGNLPCQHHKGVLARPRDTKTKKKGGVRVWSCCHAGRDDPGCVYTKHRAKYMKHDAE